jgi:hypothetical protein
VLGPHNRKDPKLGVVRLASQEFNYSAVLFVFETVASNEFGSDSRFGHIGVFVKNRTERLTDMLPDTERGYQEEVRGGRRLVVPKGVIKSSMKGMSRAKVS